VRSGLDLLRNLRFVVALDNAFDWDNGVGCLRYDGPGRDGHSAAELELQVEWLARSGLADDLERPGQVGGPHGEAVHRRARERREVHSRKHVVQDDAAGGFGDLHALDRERCSTLQNAALRLLEGE
jgi:hypothetical protein